MYSEADFLRFIISRKFCSDISKITMCLKWVRWISWIHSRLFSRLHLRWARCCEGKGVTRSRGAKLRCAGQKIDVVIPVRLWRDNPYWDETFRNMVRLCRPGGLVVMTCATNGRPEHGTSRTDPSLSPLTVELAWNYYRNLREKDFRRTVDFSRLFAVHTILVKLESLRPAVCRN